MAQEDLELDQIIAFFENELRGEGSPETVRRSVFYTCFLCPQFQSLGNMARFQYLTLVSQEQVIHA
jgi:hypothetical protein